MDAVMTCVCVKMKKTKKKKKRKSITEWLFILIMWNRGNKILHDVMRSRWTLLPFVMQNRTYVTYEYNIATTNQKRRNKKKKLMTGDYKL